METRFIKNFDELATSTNRKMALEIVETGFRAISTKSVINNAISLNVDKLKIHDKEFNLSIYKNIKIVGFGKSAVDGALALEGILGDRIKEGAVIGLSPEKTERIEVFTGTHPIPSNINSNGSKRIFEIVSNSGKDDLLIVIVSGGGSALLCYPKSECDQGVKLYNSFLGSGKTIKEMNTVRKHLSTLKGGGIAKLAYPATVVGLIFSDVPGDDFSDVASGPTYKDNTTVYDAMKLIKENRLGSFRLIETPKEDKYFENVFNFVLVSNKIAVSKMEEKAKELNFDTSIVSTDLYENIDNTLDKIFALKKENGGVVLGAGEAKLIVPYNSGKGGRNLHTGLSALVRDKIDENSVFISFASDGMDNCSASGAVVDIETIKKIKKMSLDPNTYLRKFDSYSMFDMTKDLIKTGPTGANVSDLMILLTRKNS